MDELMGQGKLVERPKVRRPLDDDDLLFLGVEPPQHDLPVYVQEQIVQIDVLVDRPERDQKCLFVLDVIPVLFEVFDEEGPCLFLVDDLALDGRIEAEPADGGRAQRDGVQFA